MNYEENRLRSFQSWPTNSPIQPESLSRAGFFATGNFFETECFWCHKKISDWQYGDQVMSRHEHLSPTCDFVVNAMSTENVPLANYNIETALQTATSDELQHQQQMQSSTADENRVDLKIEVYRLATFKNWPNPNISPQSLAKAGFYYLNQSDQVKCAWCKGVIAKWEKQDNAFVEHQRFFPDCPRVQLGPLIEIASDGIRDLGIQQISPPKKGKYSSLDARLRTYTNWPISDIQKPEALAQAGLYYQDIDDQVRCFHCNIGLRSWQKEDNPWFEHAKWFPHCQFVRLVKGLNYVTHVQEVTRQMAQANSVCGGLSGSCENTRIDCLPHERAMTIEDAMITSPVLQALDMGLNGACIRNATQRQIDSTGKPYDTVEDVVKAVLNDQVEEEETLEPEPRNSIVREVSRIINSIFGQADVESNNAVLERNVMSVDATISSNQDNLPSTPINSTLTTNNSSDGSKATFETLAQSQSEPSSSKWSKSRPLEPMSTSDTRINKCGTSSADTKMSLEEENRKLKDARLCKVCLDEEVGVVFLPCGHLVTCVQCAPGVTQCPLCRTTIKGFVRTYLS